MIRKVAFGMNFAIIGIENQEKLDYSIPIRSLSYDVRTYEKQVFDFIRCANDKKALRELVENDEYYKHMEEDAFDVAVQYTNAKELIEAKEYYREEGGGITMCKALTELIEDGREDGRQEGETLKLIKQIKKKLEKNQSIEQIADALEESVETIQNLIKEHIDGK